MMDGWMDGWLVGRSVGLTCLSLQAAVVTLIRTLFLFDQENPNGIKMSFTSSQHAVLSVYCFLKGALVNM